MMMAGSDKKIWRKDSSPDGRTERSVRDSWRPTLMLIGVDSGAQTDAVSLAMFSKRKKEVTSAT